MNPRESASESSATPASLLACARAGSPDCWDRLVQLYAPLVWHWCRTSGLQTEDQADVIQEVFQAVAGRLDRFQREAQLALQLDHPHVVHTYHAGLSHGLHYIAM